MNTKNNDQEMKKLQLFLNYLYLIATCAIVLEIKNLVIKFSYYLKFLFTHYHYLKLCDIRREKILNKNSCKLYLNKNII